MKPPMTTAIDSSGRVVIPRAARESAHLVPGTKLTVRVTDGRVELEPAPIEVRVVRKGRIHVAEPAEPTGKLTAGAVRRTVEEIRRGRR